MTTTCKGTDGLGTFVLVLGSFVVLCSCLFGLHHRLERIEAKLDAVAPVSTAVEAGAE